VPDGRVFEVAAARALVLHEPGVIYLAIPLRNVGSGIALLRGYHLEPQSAAEIAGDPRGVARHRRGDAHPDLVMFAEQQRDLYVAAGDVGFWQAALRSPGDELYERMSEAIDGAGRVTVDLFYTDHQGGQATITRFVLLAGSDERWRCDVTHHWSIDDEADHS
jgi:hypothetical protein